MDNTRCSTINNIPVKNGPIVYWMSRDQRIHNNWALIKAHEIAVEYKQPLVVVFSFMQSFPNASARTLKFMLEGLQSCAEKLTSLHIPFFLLIGEPDNTIPHFLTDIGAGAVVADFSPLRISTKWRKNVADAIPIAMYTVDAHNCIPVWITSSKQEYAARTIRPKIQKLLPFYLTEYPNKLTQPKEYALTVPAIHWHTLLSSYSSDSIQWCTPGEDAAREHVHMFIKTRLQKYEAERNDPTKDAQSHLSAYLHFGHISAQEVAREVNNTKDINTKSFLEELIVRKEISDNYCYYNPAYDSINGFPQWAQTTLETHKKDKREYTYEYKIFESGSTHDLLWNAAQMQMVKTGKMHGYMRMYWAKKILEWSETPEQALHTAIQLNDTYSLDGRDPNGYTGIAWSIGGVHDRPWFERPVFGKIRYMSYNGCKSKFDVQTYINTWNNMY